MKTYNITISNVIKDNSYYGIIMKIIGSFGFMSMQSMFKFKECENISSTSYKVVIDNDELFSLFLLEYSDYIESVVTL